jgi:hypothetical protein
MADKIYLTNCTPQKQDFYYRAQYLDQNQQSTPAARRGVRPVNIKDYEHNKLISIPDGATATIAPALARFGYIPAENVNAAWLRSAGVIAGIFSGAPIKRDARAMVIMHNRGVLEQDGDNRRKAAAVANTAHLLQTLKESGVPDSRVPPAVVVEVEQDVDSEQEGRGRLTEGLTVPTAPLMAGGKGGPGTGKGSGKSGGRTRRAA